MIRLTLPKRPDFLTDEFVKEKTEKFMLNPKARVWDIPELKEILLRGSYGKCAFSETRLNEEGKYMTIEHFYPKSLYPEKVLEWGNMLPCLNVCNSNKKEADPTVKPLVNPYFDDPKDYFYVKDGRIRALDSENVKSVNTIESYDLNNFRQLREPRLKIIDKITQTLKEIRILFNKAEDFEEGLRRLEKLMIKSGRIGAYSATKSTVILENEDYMEMRKILKEKDLWFAPWHYLEEELIFCALPHPAP